MHLKMQKMMTKFLIAQQPLLRLQDFEIIYDNNVNNDEELAHYAMFADFVSIRFEKVV